MTNQVLKIAAIIVAIAIFSFFPSVSDSQVAKTGERLNQRLYVGEVELSPPGYRPSKAFHFTLLNLKQI